MTLPAPQTSEAIFFTLQAFDAGGGYLNSQQFTAYAQVSYVVETERPRLPDRAVRQHVLDAGELPARHRRQLRLPGQPGQRGHVRAAVRHDRAEPRPQTGGRSRRWPTGTRCSACTATGSGVRGADRRRPVRVQRASSAATARSSPTARRLYEHAYHVRLLLGGERHCPRSSAPAASRPRQASRSPTPATGAVGPLHPPCLSPARQGRRCHIHAHLRAWLSHSRP